MAIQYGRVIRERSLGDALISEIEYAPGSILHEHRHDRPYVSKLLEGRYTELRDDLPLLCIPGTILAQEYGEMRVDYFLSRGR